MGDDINIYDNFDLPKDGVRDSNFKIFVVQPDRNSSFQ
jgi:hypothetical protein